MTEDIKYKICPKCDRMALDHGRGFKYQCLYRDCCWQGDLAKGETPQLTLEERVAKLEEKQTGWRSEAWMEKSDWMPINPCKECGKDHPCECVKWWTYQEKIESQKKVLEFLKNLSFATWVSKDRDSSSPFVIIESMLRRLEEQN